MFSIWPSKVAWFILSIVQILFENSSLFWVEQDGRAFIIINIVKSTSWSSLFIFWCYALLRSSAFSSVQSAKYNVKCITNLSCLTVEAFTNQFSKRSLVRKNYFWYSSTIAVFRECWLKIKISIFFLRPEKGSNECRQKCYSQTKHTDAHKFVPDCLEWHIYGPFVPCVGHTWPFWKLVVQMGAVVAIEFAFLFCCFREHVVLVTPFWRQCYTDCHLCKVLVWVCE